VRSIDTDVFTPSGYESGTPERKARFVSSLLKFIRDGFPRERFTRQLYMGLSTHGYFGFIAHYDLDGFHHAQFSTPDRQARFLKQLRSCCARDSKLDRPDLWTDVKAVLLDRLEGTEDPPLAKPSARSATAGDRRKSPAGPTLF
jgi:hypothetical protein